MHKINGMTGAGGDKALVSKGRIGRKSALSTKQVDELAVILKAGAVAAGMPTEVWTLPRVAKDHPRMLCAGITLA